MKSRNLNESVVDPVEEEKLRARYFTPEAEAEAVYFVDLSQSKRENLKRRRQRYDWVR